ncbi:stigma-specific STIG1-like protein 2 [Lycium ferocissimum]|uniref:stigma-specific STIG1-like protein 2 n=1 Tax=Lycium ferocissimum TaxID=112874 RepID=UPI0028167694|nr:stigma-specific STIG1-like protein 2 [Lycium ferocissimum]
MMKVMKILIPIAIAMALTIAIITTTTTTQSVNTEIEEELSTPKLLPLKRKVASRFLAEQEKPKNPRAADHCHKDHEICQAFEIGGKNTTCCNNKCIDLMYDDKNCGACKKKCPFTQTCCRGQCVNLSFDKRHCGYCNNRCMTGGYCFYGLCDYA